MSLISVPKLSVQNVRYGDVVKIPAASGYNFVTPFVSGNGLGIDRINPFHATNPGLFEMIEGPVNEWNHNPNFGTLLFVDGNPDFVNIAGDDVLHINPTNFPVEDEFYMVAVLDVTFPGPVQGNVVDFICLFVEKANLDIFDSTTATINMAKLEIALGLAGHNVKQRDAAYLSGQLSSFQVALFNQAMTLSLLEEDLDDDFGLQRVIEATHIVDNLGDVKTSITKQTL